MALLEWRRVFVFVWHVFTRCIASRMMDQLSKKTVSAGGPNTRHKENNPFQERSLSLEVCGLPLTGWITASFVWRVLGRSITSRMMCHQSNRRSSTHHNETSIPRGERISRGLWLPIDRTDVRHIGTQREGNRFMRLVEQLGVQ